MRPRGSPEETYNIGKAAARAALLAEIRFEIETREKIHDKQRQP
jgi:hypothetical protein